jgi:hypothetical protein
MICVPTLLLRPPGSLEVIRRTPMSTGLPTDRPAAARSLRGAAAAAAVPSLSRQFADKLSVKMSSLLGGPFPYTFR